MIQREIKVRYPYLSNKSDDIHDIYICLTALSSDQSVQLTHVIVKGISGKELKRS